MTIWAVGDVADLLRRRFRARTSWFAAVLFLLPAQGASLRTETLQGWEDYLRAVNVRVRGRASTGKPFLWIDEAPDRAAKVREGEILVSPVGAKDPKEVPFGLIHDWIGATFIPNASIEQILPVVRDYAHYKDFYRPAVIDSKATALGDSEDRFSMLLANKGLFRKTALDADYKSSQFRVDDRRRYAIAQTTRIQEIVEFGAAGQHALPEGEGTGLIWRLFGVTRYQERDGGVYVEIEAIALSRDVPASIRWFVEPIVRRTARSSLITALEQTRDAVRSNCAPAGQTLAAKAAE